MKPKLKNNKVRRAVITAVVFVLLFGIIIVGSYIYNKYIKRIPISDLYPEAEETFNENREYFKAVSEVLREKYDKLCPEDENKNNFSSDMLIIDYYYSKGTIIACNETEKENFYHKYGEEGSDKCVLRYFLLKGSRRTFNNKLPKMLLHRISQRVRYYSLAKKTSFRKV